MRYGYSGPVTRPIRRLWCELLILRPSVPPPKFFFAQITAQSPLSLDSISGESPF